MKVLVTGGAGFIGRHVVNALINGGHSAIVVDNLSTGELSNINPKAVFYELDIIDKMLQKIIHHEKPDLLVHLAAQANVIKSLESPVFDAGVNILGTINILNCCIKEGVEKLIYSSSAAVYGNPLYLGIDEKHPVNPISCYGLSKLAGEEYIRIYSKLYGMKHTIFRFSNVYGDCKNKSGEGGVVYRFLESVLDHKEAVIFGDGKQTRDLIYVEDVASACIKAMNSGNNETFNLGTGVATSINQLYETTCQITGFTNNPQRTAYRAGDILHSYFNNSKVVSSLGWEPRFMLEDGIKETLKSMRGNKADAANHNINQRISNYALA